MDKTERIFKALDLLNNVRDGICIVGLTLELEVSRRTVYDDLNTLETIGFGIGMKDGRYFLIHAPEEFGWLRLCNLRDYIKPRKRGRAARGL